jgi:hypothetical protein
MALRRRCAAIQSRAVTSLEQITYEAGRHALADQETLVSGIRQRTGTLLAAHALVASFLGGATLSSLGLDGWGWAALSALLLGLLTGAILLAPWDLKFSVTAPELYNKIFAVALLPSSPDNSRWLVEAASGYEALRKLNLRKVRRMSRLSGFLALLVVGQTFLWLIDLAH